MDVSGNSPDLNTASNAVLPEIERWQDMFRAANTDRMLEQRWQEDASLMFRKLGDQKSSKSSKNESKEARDSLKDDLAALLDHEEFLKRMEAEVLATDWMFSSSSSSNNK